VVEVSRPATCGFSTGATMASRTGKLPPPSEKKTLEPPGESVDEDPSGSNAENIAVTSKRKASFDDSSLPSCSACGIYKANSKLLICDGCDAEYHLACLRLKSVPKGRWFCGESARLVASVLCSPPYVSLTFLRFLSVDCKANDTASLHDLLDTRVEQYPAEYTRYGEICWGLSDVGYGWWPCLLDDPRLISGQPELLNEAVKFLGLKRLVYFFKRDDSPFAVLGEVKIKTWDDGLVADFHNDPVAKSHSKEMFDLFQSAMGMAMAEQVKHPEHRLESVHPESTARVTLGAKNSRKPKTKHQRRSTPVNSRQTGKGKAATSAGGTSIQNLDTEKGIQSVDTCSQIPKASSSDSLPAVSNCSTFEYEATTSAGGTTEQSMNTEMDIQRVDTSSQVSTASSSAGPDISLKCSVFEQSMDTEMDIQRVDTSSQVSTASSSDGPDISLKCSVFEHGATTSAEGTPKGFVILSNRLTATFAEAREEVDRHGLKMPKEWRFFVPDLGPVTLVQESILGPIHAFLQDINPSSHGQGTIQNHVKVYFVPDTQGI
jgi:PHD-finger